MATTLDNVSGMFSKCDFSTGCDDVKAQIPEATPVSMKRMQPTIASAARKNDKTSTARLETFCMPVEISYSRR